MNTIDFEETITISVIIPCYNCACTIAKTIESVLEQTEPVNEIIVVDDGSTDDSVTVVNRYKNKVKCISQINAGVSAARNRGIQESSSNWIAFLDGDDTWYPNKIKYQKKVIRDNGVRWCAGYVTGSGDIQNILVLDKLDVLYDVVFFLESFAKGESFQTGAFLIQKDLMMQVGLFDQTLSISEDRDLWWKIASIEPYIGYVHVPITHYNEVEEMSLMKRTKDRTDSVIVLNRLLVLIKNKKIKSSEVIRKYFIGMGFDYLMRSLSGEIFVEALQLHELRKKMSLSIIQKNMLFLATNVFSVQLNRRMFALYKKVGLLR